MGWRESEKKTINSASARRRPRWGEPSDAHGDTLVEGGETKGDGGERDQHYVQI